MMYLLEDLDETKKIITIDDESKRLILIIVICKNWSFSNYSNYSSLQSWGRHTDTQLYIDNEYQQLPCFPSIICIFCRMNKGLECCVVR